MYKQNLHTHSTFCDGKNPPEETVLKAIELGFDTIGFSIHSPTSVPRDLGGYKAEIGRLKEKYSDIINVYCGIEFDKISDCDLAEYDYIIGTHHFFKINGETVPFDRNAEVVADVIDKYFDGDGMKYAKAYYRNLAGLAGELKFDIVGHFDLITKHSEKYNFFDTESREYKDAALEALHAVAEKVKVFEVNTGAVARGFRTTPYPATFILKELKSLGGKVIISSDCHDKEYLNCCFDEATELVKACGFDKVAVMTDKGFQEIKV